jgi:signal transduction histidine kinase
MSETDLGKIFEPFFSTKTKVGGTGLGLSITYGLIQELGGKINVTSRLGKGTTFTITLPFHPPQKSAEK